MKVCTDACLFGSIIAEMNLNAETKALHCLDIGTGTGLLSLMFVQKNNNALIDAIEIDAAAAKQAAGNFQASPWKHNLHLIQANVTAHVFDKKYDLIFSNPPFFENDLKSDDRKRNLALHSAELSLEELLRIIKNNLSADGKFAVLLPYHRSTYFETLCSREGFYLAEKVAVKQTPRHPFFRNILLFTINTSSFTEKEIIIQNQAGQYSPGFIDLLKDYYLYL